MAVPLRFVTTGAVVALFTPLLAACVTGPGMETPSLARRAIEQRRSVVEPAPASLPVPALVSATLAQALDALGRDARAGDSAFQAELTRGGALVTAGRGAETGSEAWARGNVALSRMEAARASTMVAMAELDRLTLEALAASDVVGHQSASGVQAEVAALVAAQLAAMDALLR